MKKKIAMLLALALLACGIFILNSCKKDGAGGENESETEGDLEFSVLPDGSYGVSGDGLKDNEDVTEIVIPSTYNDIEVTQVPDEAFKDCVYLKKVTVSEGVTSIGKSAFEGCTALEEIIIPESVTRIGDYAFKDCLSLEGVSIPSGVSAIGKYTFGGCESLADISLPSGLTKLDDRAFSDCVSLIEVKVPSSVIYMGGGSFAGCNSLESLTIPFVGAEPDGKQNKHFGHIFGAGGYTYHATTVPKSLKTVTVLGGKAFEADVFNGCSAIENIYLPDTLESVSNSAFAGCDNLIFNVYEGGKYLGNEKNKYVCLYELTDKSVEIMRMNESARVISDAVFSGCSSLREIALPEELLAIGFEAFKGCSEITEINIPSGVKSIGDSAFLQCSKLSEVTLHAGLESIGAGAFNGCAGLLELTVPEGVEVIGEHAFSGCSSLERLTLPESLTRIESFAFNGCSSLDTVTIPSNVTFIGLWCFQNCTSLENAVFSSTDGWVAGVTSISPSDLENTSLAADYLTTTYYSSVWRRG